MFNFPSPASPGQIYASPNGPVYRFDDPVWTAVTAADVDASTFIALGYVTPFMFGGRGNGIDNDTTPVQTAIDYLLNTYGGGTVDMCGGMWSVTGLTVKPGVTLRGTGTWGEVLPQNTWGAPDSGRWDYHKPSLIVMPTTGTITLSNRAAIEGCGVMTSAVLLPGADDAAVLAVINAYAGVGITLIGDDTHVSDCMIMGYATGVYSGPTPGLTGPERPIIEANRIDCTNGVEVTDSYDTGRVRENWIFPYYGAHNTAAPGIEKTRRHGNGIYLHDVADGWEVVSNLIYGFDVDIRLKNIAFTRVTGNLCDNSYATTPKPLSGVLTEGTCNNIDLSGTMCLQEDVCFDFQHTGGVVLGDIQSGGGGAMHMRVGTGGRIALGTAGMSGTTSGTCIDFLSGIAECSIGEAVFSINTRAGPAYNIAAGDIPNVWIGRTVLIGVATVDNLGPAPTNVPMMRPSQEVLSGFGTATTTNDIKSIVNGTLAVALRGVASAVNWLSLRNSVAGQPVDIFAEGTDTDIHLRLTAKGTGEVQAFGALRTAANTVLTAGGANGLLFGNVSLGIHFGSGAPTMIAAKGSLYLRTDGSGTGDRMYVNTNSSTGWAAVTTSS